MRLGLSEIKKLSKRERWFRRGFPFPPAMDDRCNRIAVLAMSVWLLAIPAAFAQDTALATVPGTHRQILQPRNRHYTIFIPDEYDGKKPLPLILALHFGGRVTPYFGGEFLEAFVQPALSGLGAIIVAPDCTDADWTTPRSERDVIELLDYLMKKYAIDGKRMLITGYSMGGIGAWRLAARHQDRFAAALIMAGRPENSTAKVDWKIPLCVIHSRADEIIPLKPTEETVKRLKGRKIDVRFVVLEGVTHYQVISFLEPLKEATSWIAGAWK